MQVHLVDGTFELFRHFVAVPSRLAPDGREVAAVWGVLQSMIGLLREATHIGCATDQVIESFRNDLYPGYKTGDGIPEPLWIQFPLVEEGLAALGLLVWAMVEFEADDALATAAHHLERDPEVERVVVLSPDKDLYQCVRGGRVITVDRVRRITYDADAVKAKLGIPPEAIPDYLALVGDNADGFPGLPGWGARSSSALLARYGHLDAIPRSGPWDVPVRGAAKLQQTLALRWDEALLYRTLATLRVDAPIPCTTSDLEWRGAPRDDWEAFCRRSGFLDLIERPARFR